MINKGVYTYYTDRGENFKQGFRNKASFIEFFKESLEASTKQFKKVEIYTDKSGHDFLQKQGIDPNLLVPFNFQPIKWDKRYWNFPKFMVYNAQQEPFLHMDLDTKFLKPIKKELLQGDVLCEMMRHAQIMAYERLNIPQKYWDKFDPHIPCSGLLGGNNLAIFKKLYKIAAEVVDQDKQKVAYEITFNNLVALEEVLLKNLCNEDGNISIVELEKESFIHLQGQVKLSM